FPYVHGEPFERQACFSIFDGAAVVEIPHQTLGRALPAVKHTGYRVYPETGIPDIRRSFVSTTTESQNFPVSFSTLVLSLASSAILAMGLEKNPHTGKIEKDLEVARFNIDMLEMLKVKTKNNLTAEEQQFVDSVVNDLQIKFVYVNGDQKNG